MKNVIKVILSVSFIIYLIALVMLLLVGVMFVGIRGHIWSDLSLIEYIRGFFKFRTI
ncbi:positive regulator of sigma E activity [Lysinibacillus composti]|nr:positive regulator of sigma E activity [Lysinibacillus composti]